MATIPEIRMIHRRMFTDSIFLSLRPLLFCKIRWKYLFISISQWFPRVIYTIQQVHNFTINQTDTFIMSHTIVSWTFIECRVRRKLSTRINTLNHITHILFLVHCYANKSLINRYITNINFMNLLNEIKNVRACTRLCFTLIILIKYHPQEYPIIKVCP